MSKEDIFGKPNKRAIYITVAILVVASVVYRSLGAIDLKQTSILFVGLPALITILVVKYTNPPKNAYGIVFRVITLFLLMSSILLGEGMVCILFAAPIFYGVGALAVFIYQYSKKRANNKDSNLHLIAPIPFILLIMQPWGIVNEPDLQMIQVSKIYEREVGTHMFNKQPDPMSNFPSVFQIGFPKPLSINGEGINIGDTRTILFESKTKGKGALVLKIANINEKSATFEVVKDETHMGHWLTWDKFEVELETLDGGKTKVTWTSKYRCDLGPQWYFETMERVFVAAMNKHLLQLYFG